MRCVYFISGEHWREGGVPIKIGFTNNLEKRLSSIRTVLPNVWVMGIIRGAGREKERELHDRFAAHRTSGEWFNPHPDIVSFIGECIREEHAVFAELCAIERRMEAGQVRPGDLEWVLDVAFEMHFQLRRRV
jgi:hypothetical protein